MARGAFPPVAPSAPNMVARLVPIKRRAGEGGVDQLVAQLGGAAVGDRERGELLAMGGQFLGEVGESEDQGAGGRRIDAAGWRWRGRSDPTGAGGGTKRPFLKLPRRCGVKARGCGGRGTALLDRSGSANPRGTCARGRRWPIVPAWATRRCLRPAQASGVVSGSASSSWRHRRASSGSGAASRASNASRPPELTTSSGSWPGGQLDEAQGAVGAEQGQSAGRGADRGLLARAVAVEAEDRRRIEAPQPLELRFGQRGAVGRDDFGDAGAVERDHVHIAFDHDQPLGGAARGAGAVEVVERAALVEEDRLRRVQIFGLAGAEDAAAEADDPAARVADRDHQPPAEAVVAVLPALLRLDQHAGFDQLVFAELAERPL